MKGGGKRWFFRKGEKAMWVSGKRSGEKEFEKRNKLKGAMQDG